MENEIKYLNKAIKEIREGKIHYSQMTSWSKNRDEGYNDGLEAASLYLEKRVKYLNKRIKNGK
jgi:hypothetical protein